MSHPSKKVAWDLLGFALLTAWFCLQNGWQPLIMLLSAAALHEMGHWGVLRLLRTPMGRIHISAGGAALPVEQGALSYPQELAATLAGPGVNLLCGFLLAALGPVPEAAAWGGAHLVLGLFNLLPVRILDGGRALGLALCWMLGADWGERITSGVCLVTALAMAVLLLWALAINRSSLWLLPAIYTMLQSAWREGKGRR